MAVPVAMANEEEVKRQVEAELLRLLMLILTEQNQRSILSLAQG